ncbi:hypothetical protein CY34DRAFT_804917 [Suillus luteus UH-Slu-Lm8-n1]|uniref:Uncharacterized protein n=1 Tax=Suillus luteus UH-Slu-Lm8-n1 TaxID=930992 RepID=A0A0D0AXH3_9AGAM|nr:hypothetical protein CY34DRAFT_804917 [Suillus luteus UH-Slu-Lm8-n1]
MGRYRTLKILIKKPYQRVFDGTQNGVDTRRNQASYISVPLRLHHVNPPLALRDAPLRTSSSSMNDE